METSRPAWPWFLGALIALVAVCYGPSLSASWHYDDYQYICLNPSIRAFEKLPQIQLESRRALLWLSHATCYALSAHFGRHAEANPDVRIFRGWNIGCHLIAALALWGLVRRLERRRADTGRQDACGTTVGQASSLSAAGQNAGGTPDRLEACPTIAPWAALLFAAHPLATESVTYVSGRPNSQGGMFYLIGLYLAAGAFARMAGGKGAAREHALWGRRGWLWPLLLSWTCGAAAVATKESYLTFPFAFAALYLAFYRRPGQAWIWLSTLAGLALAALALPYSYQRLATALYGAGAAPLRALATQACAVPVMLLKAVIPVGLNIDHDFATHQSLRELPVLGGLLCIAGLLSVAGRSAWRGAIPGFALLLGLLSIAPTNSVVERGDIASERNFYLAAAAGAVLLAWLCARGGQGWAAWRARRAGKFPRAHGGGKNTPEFAAKLTAANTCVAQAAACGVILSAFAVLCVARNTVYSDELTLWRATAASAPRKVRPWRNYGLAAAERNNLDEANEALTRAVTVSEERAAAWRPDEAAERQAANLAYADLAAVSYRRLAARGEKSFGAVEEIYNRGLVNSHYDPDVARSYADFLIQTGAPERAIPVMTMALGYSPWAVYLYQTLGRAELEAGHFQSAREHLRRALTARMPHVLGAPLDPSPSEQTPVIYYLALAEIALGEPDAVRAIFCERLPEYPAAVEPLCRHVSAHLGSLADTSLAALHAALAAAPGGAALDALRLAVARELARRKP